MENNPEKNMVRCPILDRDIDVRDCYDAALVFEEMSPLTELPDSMKFTNQNQSTCLKCKYHPD